MSLSVVAGAADKTKTHSRFQPWVLVKVSVQQAPTASLTTTTRLTVCDTFSNIASSI
jgi:recombinational DNA repair protein (RecF pathway)